MARFNGSLIQIQEVKPSWQEWLIAETNYHKCSLCGWITIAKDVGKTAYEHLKTNHPKTFKQFKELKEKKN